MRKQKKSSNKRRQDVLYITSQTTVVRVRHPGVDSFTPNATWCEEEMDQTRVDRLTLTSESQFTTHDIEIPFGSVVIPSNGNTLLTRQLRVVLLSPSTVNETKLDDTFKRIQHFASLTGGEDLAIVFLLNPSRATKFVSAKAVADGSSDDAAKVDAIYAYTKLQAEMMNHREIPHVPILPLANIDNLSQLLRKHTSNLSRPPPKQKPAATSFELLQLCTASPPMSQQTAFILSDLFTNLKELATTCSAVTSAPNSSSPSARAASSLVSGVYDLGLGMSTQDSHSTATSKLKRLRDLVGEQECREIVDFWKEEWTVD